MKKQTCDIGVIKSIYICTIPTAKERINSYKFLTTKEKKLFKPMVDLGFSIDFYGVNIPESKKSKVSFECLLKR